MCVWGEEINFKVLGKKLSFSLLAHAFMFLFPSKRTHTKGPYPRCSGASSDLMWVRPGAWCCPHTRLPLYKRRGCVLSSWTSCLKGWAHNPVLLFRTSMDNVPCPILTTRGLLSRKSLIQEHSNGRQSSVMRLRCFWGLQCCELNSWYRPDTSALVYQIPSVISTAFFVDLFSLHANRRLPRAARMRSLMCFGMILAKHKRFIITGVRATSR